jgi:hypothetical protein
MTSLPPLLACLVTGCPKVMHYTCFKTFILDKNKLDDPFESDDQDSVCCSKLHLTKAMKQGKNKTDDANINIPWDKDGMNGPNDPHNSLAILLDWLTTHGNYGKLKGDNANGATKIRIVGEICNKINAAGVRKERTTKSVLSKIDHLIRQYKKASDWANQTGAGVLETQGREPFNQAVSISMHHVCL